MIAGSHIAFFSDVWAQDSIILFKNHPANQYQPWEQRLPVMCFKGYGGDFGEGGSAEQKNKTVVTSWDRWKLHFFPVSRNISQLSWSNEDKRESSL